MSDTNNPYHSPEASISTVEPLISQGGLTEDMLKSLNEASPWLRFMGIMGFIGSGLMAMSGLFCLVFMPFVSGIMGDASGIFNGIFGSFGPLMLVYALYFLGAGVLMFFPALFTYKFGAKIRIFLRTNSNSELEQAFRNNKSLWKFNGILAIVGMAIIPVVTIISIIVAVTMTLRY